MEPVHYFVTDIETDGPSPLVNSMLSFATVIVREDGEILDSFEATMVPLESRRPDPVTMKWWETNPEAWNAATSDPRPGSEVMEHYAAWIKRTAAPRAFAARPLIFDGMWIDQYLRLFTPYTIFDVPYWGNCLFDQGSLDIGSYMTGILNRSATNRFDASLPKEWLGDHPHTHRAIDDARGYASLVSRLLLLAREAGRHPSDYAARRGG